MNRQHIHNNRNAFLNMTSPFTCVLPRHCRERKKRLPSVLHYSLYFIIQVTDICNNSLPIKCYNSSDRTRLCTGQRRLDSPSWSAQQLQHRQSKDNSQKKKKLKSHRWPQTVSKTQHLQVRFNDSVPAPLHSNHVASQSTLLRFLLMVITGLHIDHQKLEPLTASK